MTKIWFTDWYPAGKNEASVLAALNVSPVAIGVYISNNIYSYSGGNVVRVSGVYVSVTESTFRVIPPILSDRISQQSNDRFNETLFVTLSVLQESGRTVSVRVSPSHTLCCL